MKMAVLPGMPARMLDPGFGTRLRRGLIGFWPLDEASGTRRDAFGNASASLNLSDTNSVGTEAGPSVILPTAANFVAASSQYLGIAANHLVNMGPGVRMAASGWVYLNTSAATVQTIMSEWNAPGSRVYVIRTLSSRFSFSVTADGSTAVTATANVLGAPSTGTWYFLAVYYDGKTVGISVNGGAWDTTAHTGDIFNNSVAVPFEIGRANANGQYLDGRLAHWGLWKRPVNTAREIGYLYNGGRGRAFPWKDAPAI